MRSSKKSAIAYNIRNGIVLFEKYRLYPHAVAEVNGVGGCPVACCPPFENAAEYINIGIIKIDEMLKLPNGPFACFAGAAKYEKIIAF